MSIPGKPDGLGNHHGYLVAIASAMGPRWSVSVSTCGRHHLTDGTVWLAVSWRPPHQRLRFRGYYGQYRVVNVTTALTGEPAAVARELLVHHESAVLDSARSAAGIATDEAGWRAPRRAAQDLLAPFEASPWTSEWTSTGLDADANAAVVAGRVHGKVRLNRGSSTAVLVVESLTLPGVLEMLAALDEGRLADGLAALLAVPAAVNGANWCAEDMLAPFVVSKPGLDPAARVVMVAGCVRGTLQLSQDGSHCSLVMGRLTLPEVLEVLVALEEGRLAEAFAALMALPAPPGSSTRNHHAHLGR